MTSPTNINDLNENVFNEIFSYVSLRERVRCECVCRRWRSMLMRQADYQRTIKLCFETKFRLPARPVCTSRPHNPTSHDVIYFDENNLVEFVKIDHLFTKFVNLKSIHIQSKDVKLLKRANVLSSLAKHANNLEHFEIDVFEGPFTRNDLQLLYKNWSKNLRHLIVRFQTDQGKILNRKTIMKFFEICVELELFYWRTPYLCEQSLDYVPRKLSSLHLNDADLDFDSLSLLVQDNKSIFKQLRLSSVTSGQLDYITSNLSLLNLLIVDSIQLDDQSNGYDVLMGINRLERLEVLRFILSNDNCVHGNQIDKEFASIIRSCKSMRRVHIENALITDQCLTLVADHWRKLESFKLYTHFNPYSSPITDQTLIQFLKLKHLHTLALPNHSFSQNLVEQLIDRPTLCYLIIREPCLFMNRLFERMVTKATIATFNKYKLKINDEAQFLQLSNIDLPINFQFKQSKIFIFDLHL